MIAQRILAVLSAFLLVGSVALATVGPPMVSLGQALYLMDEGLVERLHLFIAGHLTDWTWSGVDGAAAVAAGVADPGLDRADPRRHGVVAARPQTGPAVAPAQSVATALHAKAACTAARSAGSTCSANQPFLRSQAPVRQDGCGSGK